MAKREEKPLVRLYRRKDSPCWYVCYRENGKRVRRSVGPDRRIAEIRRSEIEKRLLAKKYLGVEPSEPEPPKHYTLRELAERYVAFARQYKRSWRRDEQIFRVHLLPF